ncbi:hypothetical protein [Amycolatopsis jiangsuensis]|uniref:PPE family protein n=1 Tax=Amycolatopsis jiangsuensis TaxID=1181879 RepID=A0A840J268_9PSEU|nr:hypothetical protein [Amycolatopsis jiangsuensis]MBB4687993.1 hypothetical protein [Amycolatopsis jiangsuensis]
MNEPRAQHREYEADYYSHTHSQLSQQAAPGRFGAEDQQNVRDGVDARTQQAAANYSVTQGQHLVEGQTLRGDGPAPDANYASHDHQELYDMVHTDMDAGDIDAKGRVANKLGNWLADISSSLSNASSAAGIEWQGSGAEAAHGFFQQTAKYTTQTANAAQLSSNRYSQQSAAADYAQKNMPEPTGFNQDAEMKNVMQAFSGGDPLKGAAMASQMQAKQQQADAAHQQATQVMHGLDSTYHETSTSQPAYTPPPQLGGTDNSTHISSASPVTATGGSAYSGPGGGGNFSATGQPVGPGGSGFTPPGSTVGGGNGVAPGPGASTGSGAFNPTGTGPGGFRGPTAPGGIGGRLVPEALGLGAGGGNLGNAGQDTPRSRPGIGTGRSGGGYAGNRVAGGSKGPGGVPEEGGGNRSGSGKAAGLERGATAASEAAKAGKNGVAGGAAGNGKKKEEDKEHKNKVPTQIDPDEVFEIRPERGPDGEKITPPVIGG